MMWWDGDGIGSWGIGAWVWMTLTMVILWGAIVALIFVVARGWRPPPDHALEDRHDRQSACLRSGLYVGRSTKRSTRGDA
jgi:hypothetical protein